MMETERLSRDYCLGIYFLSRGNKNERFLVADESRDFVSVVMAKRSVTSKTKILIYGTSPQLVSWYENVLKASRCPIDIIILKGDECRIHPKTPSESSEAHYLQAASD